MSVFDKGVYDATYSYALIAQIPVWLNIMHPSHKNRCPNHKTLVTSDVFGRPFNSCKADF